MDKNTRVLLLIFTVVITMVGLSFASVPLYDVFCRVTGFGGTTQESQVAPNIILERRISVNFHTNTSDRLPWQFKAETHKMDVNVGQESLIAFIAQNNTSTPTAGTAVYNVTPPKVGKYFHKTQCFCFDEQMLTPHEKMTMPVSFYIDPAIVNDKAMNDVTSITLSYSFFPAESEELDEALEAFYNEQNTDKDINQ